ncbi:MAG: hypothetical protein EP330_20845 [Deltaproteobacteria bacterium]|nr:MAG: hypothetical protein EP330_20845 [Deltaproteobacteria bacterium]
MVLLLALIALAQSPLAIPGGPGPEGPRRAVSEATLERIRAYRHRHLQLVPEVRYRFSRAQPGPFGPEPWAPPPPPVEMRTLTVYQGREQLQSAALFTLLGQPELAAEVERTVLRNRRFGAVLYTMGAMGAVATLGGLWVMDRSDLGGRAGEAMAVAGLGVMGLGLVGGTFPVARARRVEWDPTESLPLYEVEVELADYNDALRRELGLREADVAIIDRPSLPVIRGR